MGFLVRCPQCGQYSNRGHTCPIQPGEGEFAPERSDAELVEEFRARRRQHRANYTKYMTLIFAWVTLTLLLQAGAVVLERYCFPLETILNVFSTSLWEFFVRFLIGFLLVGAWFLLAWGVRQSRNWWPIELECPRCDARLDELGMKVRHCPGCQLWLGPQDDSI